MKIGVVLIATNSYIILAVRFIKRFMQFYKGTANITFYIFTDEDIRVYLPNNINVVYIETHHHNWIEGTDSKFSSIVSIENLLLNEDYVTYFDADTNVDKDFTEEWFLGDSVGGQHYGDAGHMLTQGRPFDRNPRSKAYIPVDTVLPQMYFYGAFFCFSSKKMLEFCKTLINYQVADKQWGYEPGVNDESYINREFHFNPPSKVVPCTEFKFLISDKGGIGETRRMNLNIEPIKKVLRKKKDEPINIANGIVI